MDAGEVRMSLACSLTFHEHEFEWPPKGSLTRGVKDVMDRPPARVREQAAVAGEECSREEVGLPR
jgi:hypothetical protein